MIQFRSRFLKLMTAAGVLGSAAIGTEIATISPLRAAEPVFISKFGPQTKPAPQVLHQDENHVVGQNLKLEHLRGDSQSIFGWNSLEQTQTARAPQRLQPRSGEHWGDSGKPLAMPEVSGEAPARIRLEPTQPQVVHESTNKLANRDDSASSSALELQPAATTDSVAVQGLQSAPQDPTRMMLQDVLEGRDAKTSSSAPSIAGLEPKSSGPRELVPLEGSVGVVKEIPLFASSPADVELTPLKRGQKAPLVVEFKPTGDKSVSGSDVAELAREPSDDSSQPSGLKRMRTISGKSKRPSPLGGLPKLEDVLYGSATDIQVSSTAQPADASKTLGTVQPAQESWPPADLLPQETPTEQLSAAEQRNTDDSWARPQIDSEPAVATASPQSPPPPMPVAESESTSATADSERDQVTQQPNLADLETEFWDAMSTAPENGQDPPSCRPMAELPESTTPTHPLSPAAEELSNDAGVVPTGATGDGPDVVPAAGNFTILKPISPSQPVPQPVIPSKAARPVDETNAVQPHNAAPEVLPAPTRKSSAFDAQQLPSRIVPVQGQVATTPAGSGCLGGCVCTGAANSGTACDSGGCLSGGRCGSTGASRNGCSPTLGELFCPPTPQATGYFGAETTHLWAIDEPTQQLFLTDTVTGQVFPGYSDAGLGHGVRTWVGVENENTGARVRYWYFSEENIDNNPFVPGSIGSALIETHNLESQTLDIEMTQKFRLRRSHLNTSFGARYARLERNAAVTGFATLGNDLVDVSGVAMGANKLDALGFTGSIGGERQLFRRAGRGNQNGVAFFWNFRGSVLRGDALASAFTEASASTRPPAAPDSDSAQDFFSLMSTDDTFQIYDFQAGLTYDWSSGWCPGIWSMRLGVEYQHWETGDLFAPSVSSALVDGVAGATPFGGSADGITNAEDGDLDLIGGFWGLEWRY